MDSLYQQVRAKKIRLTMLRKILLDIFQEEARPLTVPQLQELLQTRGMMPNKTSLYRHLTLLCSKNILQEIPLDTSVTHYELQHHHHHHFTCQKCNTIQCLSDKGLEQSIHILEKKLKTDGLRIYRHQFSFSGLCKKCTA